MKIKVASKQQRKNGFTILAEMFFVLLLFSGLFVQNAKAGSIGFRFLGNLGILSVLSNENQQVQELWKTLVTGEEEKKEKVQRTWIPAVLLDCYLLIPHEKLFGYEEYEKYRSETRWMVGGFWGIEMGPGNRMKYYWTQTTYGYWQWDPWNYRLIWVPPRTKDWTEVIELSFGGEVFGGIFGFHGKFEDAELCLYIGGGVIRLSPAAGFYHWVDDKMVEEIKFSSDNFPVYRFCMSLGSKIKKGFLEGCTYGFTFDGVLAKIKEVKFDYKGTVGTLRDKDGNLIAVNYNRFSMGFYFGFGEDF